MCCLQAYCAYGAIVMTVIKTSAAVLLLLAMLLRQSQPQQLGKLNGHLIHAVHSGQRKTLHFSFVTCNKFGVVQNSQYQPTVCASQCSTFVRTVHYCENDRPSQCRVIFNRGTDTAAENCHV